MIPEAKICHLTNERLRLKIAERRDDKQFFLSVQDKFQKAGFTKTFVNPLTGSIIFECEKACIEEIIAFAEKNQLFVTKTIENKISDSEAFFNKIIAPFSDINAGLQKISGGSLDLPVSIFILFLAMGFIDILRGNLKMPPWYTSFWFAFGTGVFIKALFDSLQKDNA